ncbi:hypothetical protein COL154_002108 [Colletotrichum chrysophilum]|uniref:uncharacterized protein n=1 Tax=Colletotrichum chrysophilum TaxID=1836956 RepID=UPI0023001BA2|nr:uncharacterized protein COL26b_003122 [Colletotrichum chrysophilum]KAJ0354862.1 hypothetical protein KNSL1_001145 [Colletotrichum chrysophilum]KAJ0369225.1 hypothetical protein COL154_002108 [Colletotrichum chrysophilum]KAJ0378523.1 hypothetical protein COL26b_003122 [Colletotrichum chrysophilum]
MAGKKGAGENSKKAAGNARKAEAAAQKSAAEDAKKAAAEDAEWSKGSKSNAKKTLADTLFDAREAEAAKKAEAARKKAEREAALKEEEANTPGRSAPKNAKTAVKKTRGLDLSQLDDKPSGSLAALNASGIDNALDALSLTGSSDAKVDRHPERRFKAAYAAFEERRLSEMDEDGSGKGLRLQQRKDKIRKEFEKSPENPFNQVNARFDSSKEELAQLKANEKSKIENRLGSK